MYDSTKPQSGITLSAGRAVTQANFAALQTYLARDHVSLDANSADSGKHKAIRLTEQAAPTTLTNELGLYAKDTGTEPDLFIRRQSSGTEIQMTVGDPLAGTNGYTFLPGGIIMQWGTVGSVAKGGTVLTFPKAFPNHCYNVVGMCHNSFAVATALNLAVATCTLKQSDTTNQAVFWIAIGN